MPYPHFHRYLIVLLILSVAGFQPSYLAMLSQSSWTHHYHGLSAAAFLSLMIVQSALIHSRRFIWHKRLGKVSLLLVIFYIHSGLLSLHALLHSKSPALQRLAAEISLNDLLSLMSFGVLYVLAIRHRFFTDFHSRCWVALSLLFVTPALSRALDFWIPGFAITSVEHFWLNVSLARLAALLTGAILLYRDWPLKQHSTPLLVIMLISLAQLAATWIAGPGSLWRQISLALSELPVTTVFLLSAGLALIPAIMCAGYFYKRA